VADIGVVVGVIGKIKPRISNYTSKNRMLAPEMAECRLLERFPPDVTRFVAKGIP
jgi:hypothetical protein